MASVALPHSDHLSQKAHAPWLLELDSGTGSPRGMQICGGVLILAAAVGLFALWLHPLSDHDDPIQANPSLITLTVPALRPWALDVRSPSRPEIGPNASNQPQTVVATTNTVSYSSAANRDTTDNRAHSTGKPLDWLMKQEPTA